MMSYMFRLALALLIVLQPALVAQCAQLAAAPPSCVSQCGDMNHPQAPQEKAPCCRILPIKQDPQAVKTATVELRGTDPPSALVVAHDAVTMNPLGPFARAEATPTDLRHKRPLTEILCVLLV